MLAVINISDRHNIIVEKHPVHLLGFAVYLHFRMPLCHSAVEHTALFADARKPFRVLRSTSGVMLRLNRDNDSMVRHNGDPVDISIDIFIFEVQVSAHSHICDVALLHTLDCITGLSPLLLVVDHLFNVRRYSAVGYVGLSELNFALVT